MIYYLVGVVVGLACGIVLGFSLVSDSLKKDCDSFGFYRLGEQVYQCQPAAKKKENNNEL